MATACMQPSCPSADPRHVDQILPAMPNAANLLVHTGNMISSSFITNKQHSTTEEIKRVFGCCVAHWSGKVNKHTTKNLTDIEIDNLLLPVQQPVDLSQDRDHYKLTAKLFIINDGPNCVKEALNALGSRLNTSHVETLILSFPPDTPPQKSRYESLAPYWSAAESVLANQGSAPANDGCDGGDVDLTGSAAAGDGVQVSWTLGVADMDLAGIKDMQKWARVPPAIDQLNIDTFGCNPPGQLVDYCKEHDIQLLTHGDPARQPVMTSQGAQEAIKQYLPLEVDHTGWNVAWVLRYSTLIRCRGIIHSKGYLVKLTRGSSASNGTTNA